MAITVIRGIFMRTFDIVMVLPETFFSMGSNIGVGRHGASHHFIARHGASLHFIARHEKP